MLSYRTTTREGYREYKSNPKVCVSFSLLSVCTQSQNSQKVITRHVWKDDLEFCEEICHQRGMKELYKKRKETIERLFGTAKEYHNLRYTREKGKSKMEDKVGLTLACLNIKKLVKWIANIPFFCSKSDFWMEMPDDKVNSFENTKRQTPKMTFVFVLKLFA